MSNREYQDLIRSIEKKSPKRHIGESKKFYKIDHGTTEYSVIKPIIAQDTCGVSNFTESCLTLQQDTKGSLFDKSSNVIKQDVQYSNNSLKALLLPNKSVLTRNQTEHVPLGAVKNIKNMEKENTSHSAQEPWQISSTEYYDDQFHTSHPVYRAISLINGNINRMDLSQMKTRCKDLQLDCNGKRDAVKRRLKEYYKTEKLIEAGLLERRSSDERNTDYFVVVDFEATCEEKNPPGYPHEIIEFPAVLVSAKEKRSIDVFHSFVRPTINPILSEFCRNLTGISQETVDNAETFGVVHKRFLEWMTNHELGTRYTYTMVTDGPWDMGRFLYLQTRHLDMLFPFSYAANWANLRKCFANFYKCSFYGGSSNKSNSKNTLPGLKTMLEMLGMEFHGSPHSGVDDARNIASVLVRLLADQAFVRVNEKIFISKIIQADDDNRTSRLSNVIPVPRKEAEKLFRAQKKEVQRYISNHQQEEK